MRPNLKKPISLFFAAAAIALAIRLDAQQPTGITFHPDTLYRTDARGDNWCLTWAADDTQITSMDDGNWLGERTSYHNRLYRIRGDYDNFTREDLPGYPSFDWGKGSWFGYGIVAIDGALYSVISKTPRNSWSGPFRGIKILQSTDNAATWGRVSRQGEVRMLAPDDEAKNEVTPGEMFFLEEFGLTRDEIAAYPFSFVDFVQHGQDNRAAQDDYVYIYSPEGAYAHRLLLARVPRGEVGTRDAWEYFQQHEGDGAAWTRDIHQRGVVHEFPEKSSKGHYFGWYSWLPSVVWNEPLGVYLMVNGGTYGGRDMTASDKDYFDAWMHTETGSLGFWWADKPWGPWKELFYDEYWIADDAANRTYQPKLSPKWISEDGRQMTLIWSDAQKNDQGRSHTVHYTWNQMRITIVTETP